MGGPVDASGVSRDRISIEITESVIGSDFDFIKAQIERFQKLGFPVWMDDFGSGYSSLDVLQSIKFDLIKCDSLEEFKALAFYSKLVLEEDRQQFLEAVTTEKIVKNTDDRTIYSVPFRRVFEKTVYQQII